MQESLIEKIVTNNHYLLSCLNENAMNDDLFRSNIFKWMNELTSWAWRLFMFVFTANFFVFVFTRFEKKLYWTSCGCSYEGLINTLLCSVKLPQNSSEKQKFKSSDKSLITIICPIKRNGQFKRGMKFLTDLTNEHFWNNFLWETFFWLLKCNFSDW